MNRQGSERRRARRVRLEVPLTIKPAQGRESEALKETTKDVSLAGVYFETRQPGYAVDGVHIVSVVIPEDSRRDFPFTRLAGGGRVVRVQELPAQEGEAEGRKGVAMEFSHDTTILTAMPVRS